MVATGQPLDGDTAPDLPDNEEERPLDMLNYMLDLYEQTPEFRLDQKNFEEEMEYKSRCFTKEQVNEYIRRHPGDPIGEYAKLVYLYQQTRPMHEWDVERMMDISSVTEPFIDGLRKMEPKIRAGTELDVIANTTALLTISLPKDMPLSLSGEMYEQFRKVLEKAEEFDICPMSNGEIDMTFAFGKVKVPMK